MYPETGHADGYDHVATEAGTEREEHGPPPLGDLPDIIDGGHLIKDRTRNPYQRTHPWDVMSHETNRVTKVAYYREGETRLWTRRQVSFPPILMNPSRPRDESGSLDP